MLGTKAGPLYKITNEIFLLIIIIHKKSRRFQYTKYINVGT